MKRAEAAAIARAVKKRKQPTLQNRFWMKVEKRGDDECWPWRAGVRNPNEGYGAFWLDGRHQPASKVAWLLSGGKIKTGLVVCHHCDNPSCCNPRHLFIGTARQNNDDKVSKKRHAFGSKIGTSKLTEAQAAEIKRLKPAGRAPYGYRTRLANQFNVSPATITDVWSRRWTHLN